jgi:hypothetical protein
MEHAARMVDVLDKQGKVIGSKPRQDINKAVDIFHTIFVLLVTPRGEVVLGVIPAREDLPNYYARQMGSTMATIRRTGETSMQAAKRGVQRELFIDDADLKLLGDLKLDLPEGRTMFGTVFYMVGDPPASYSVIDIDTLAVVTTLQLRDILLNHQNELAPTFRYIWDAYYHKLPV